MRDWPWITIVATAVVALSPVGMGFLAALGSNEQLSRAIALPFVAGAALVAVAAGIGETVLRRRRARRG